MKTLQQEIVEWLRQAADLEKKYLDTTSMGTLPKDCAVSEWCYRAAKVESARCDNCGEYNKINGFCDRWHHQVCGVTPCMCFIQVGEL